MLFILAQCVHPLRKGMKLFFVNRGIITDNLAAINLALSLEGLYILTPPQACTLLLPYSYIYEPFS